MFKLAPLLAAGVMAGMSPQTLLTTLLNTPVRDAELPHGFSHAQIEKQPVSANGRKYHAVGLVDVALAGADAEDALAWVVFSRHADAIVYGTGFKTLDFLAPMAVTGLRGRSLDQTWHEGAEAYLGISVAGFPNFFMLTGPGSPSVLSNMAVSIEQHVDWVARCLEDMREDGLETIEPTTLADGSSRAFLEDGDEVVIGATAPGRDGEVISFGEVRGRVAPAQ